MRYVGDLMSVTIGESLKKIAATLLIDTKALKTIAK